MASTQDYINYITDPKNSDLMNYYQANANNLGMSAVDYAKYHYDTYGQNEGRSLGGQGSTASAATSTPSSTQSPFPTTTTGSGSIKIYDNSGNVIGSTLDNFISGSNLQSNTPTVDTLSQYTSTQPVYYTLYGAKNGPAGEAELAYMQRNPDVWQAYLSDTSGMTADQFAQQHYQDYGSTATESRLWGTKDQVDSLYSTSTTDAGTTGNSMSLFGQDISGLKTGSYSGLPQEQSNRILDALVPKLITAANNYRSDIDNTTKAASDLYGSQARQSMKDAGNTILGALARRGIFGGELAADAYGKGLADVATSAADKTFESAMTGSAMKAQEPTILANILGLGKTTESYNQLAPYETLLNGLLGLQ